MEQVVSDQISQLDFHYMSEIPPKPQQIESALQYLQTNGDFPQYVLFKGIVTQDYVPLTSVKRNILKRLNIKSFSQLIAEVVYLLYVADCHNVSIDFNPKNMYVKNYELEDEQSQISTYIFYELNEQNVPIIPLKDAMQYILQQAELTQSNDLRDFIMQYRSINLSSCTTTEDIISCLQLTQLMRKNSVLLRFSNLSIIAHIRSRRQYLQTFQTYLAKEVSMLQSYELAKDRNQPEGQLQKMQILLQQHAKKMLMLQLGNNVIVEDSVSNQASDTYELCFILKFKERNLLISNQITAYKIIASTFCLNPEFQSLEYSITYSSERASLNIQLYTSIQLNKEISDFITMQTNQFGFNSANVTLVVCEKSNTGGSKSRYLTFKAYSCFIYRESIIDKILLVMDTLLLAKLVFEPYFKQGSRFQIQRDMSIIHKKIDHYQIILNDMFDGLINEQKKKL